MKRACLVALIVGWLLPAPAFASPCIVGSLANYVALGAGGCNIGTAQFFNFVDLPLQGGAAPISDNGSFVSPVLTGNPGFNFNVNSLALAGDLFERRIGYSLSGPGFIGNQLALTGSNVSTDGAITVIEDKCLGAAFGAGGFCSGIDAQLTGFDLGPLFGQSLTDSLTFPSKPLFGVIVDITVDGGTDGTAGLTSVSSRFTPQAVPEPATLTLLSIGLAAITGRRLRNRKSPHSSAITRMEGVGR
jgi:hypothetical protein